MGEIARASNLAQANIWVTRVDDGDDGDEVNGTGTINLKVLDNKKPAKTMRWADGQGGAVFTINRFHHMHQQETVVRLRT
jgi:hypothetical protein